MSGSTRTGRARNLLVLVEVAQSLILLVAAGLIVESFARLVSESLGYRSRNVVTFALALPTARYPDANRRNLFYYRLLDRLKSLPGVQGAAATTGRPIDNYEKGALVVEGKSSSPRDAPMIATRHVISPDYFMTIEITVVSGRQFNEGDRENTDRLAIVNEAFVRRFLPGESPLGKRIKNGDADSQSPWFTIVGVVADTRSMKYNSLIWETEPQVFFPLLQVPSDMATRGMRFVVRTTTDPNSVIAAVRREVMDMDRGIPVVSPMPLDQIEMRQVVRLRLYSVLLVTFGAVAVALTLVGIYAALRQSVLQRSHEIGIRIAIGATRSDILRLVAREGMVPVLVGLIVGSALALALTRILSSLLYGVSSTAALTFVTASILLSAIALAGCAIPAYQATRIDPTVALRR